MAQQSFVYQLVVEADVTDVTLSSMAKELEVEVAPVSQLPQMAALRGTWESLGMLVEIFFDDPYLLLEARKCHLCH